MKEITAQDVIFDDDVIIDGTEIQGYAWATNVLVARTTYRPVYDTDMINFYPVYDVADGSFRVVVTSYENDEYAVHLPLSMSDQETKLVKDAFLEYARQMLGNKYDEIMQAA